MPMNGYDIHFTDPGEFDELSCRVCGTTCRVERNVFGPTCAAAAMYGHGCLHDTFRCPHAKTAWHEQALGLLHEIEATRSARVKALIQADLDDLLAAHLPKSE